MYRIHKNIWYVHSCMSIWKSTFSTLYSIVFYLYNFFLWKLKAVSTKSYKIHVYILYIYTCIYIYIVNQSTYMTQICSRKEHKNVSIYAKCVYVKIVDQKKRWHRCLCKIDRSGSLSYWYINIHTDIRMTLDRSAWSR